MGTNNASIGAILTAVVTVFLLGQQSEDEEIRQRNATRYQERLRAYDAFLDGLHQITADGKLTGGDGSRPDEIKLLISQLARVRLLSSDATIDYVVDQLRQLFDRDAYPSGPPNELIVDKYFRIVDALQRELEGGGGSMKELDKRFGKISEVIKGFAPLPADEALVPDSDRTDSTTIVWYANVGGRCWDDMRRANFWSAGGAIRYRRAVEKMKEGDTVYVYLSGAGYVGRGVVTRAAAPLEQVVGDQSVGPKTRDRMASNLAAGTEADSKEYAVGVKWVATRSATEAVRQDGMFASPLTACRLRHEETIRLLAEELRESR